MEQKVCIDSDIAIEILKGTKKGAAFLDTCQDKVMCITSISIFELYLREKNLDAIDQFASRTEILSLSEDCARKAAEVFKQLKSSGRLIGIRDIFIAATAIVNQCPLATLNIKDFDRIKELRLHPLN